MEDNNSFLYPQGFHIGALYYIVKNLGDRNFSYPFNPETYFPKAYKLPLGTFEREFRYRIWALMEMGLIEDHRKTGNYLSYQHLTKKGLKIYKLIRKITFPGSFFNRISGTSWDMTLSPADFIRFTLTLRTSSHKLFSLLHEVIVSMDCSQDFIGYFISKGKHRIKKDDLYNAYFSDPYIMRTFRNRALTPPNRSYETSRRRVSVVIGLLESIGEVRGYSNQVNQYVNLLGSSGSLSQKHTEEIEKESDLAVLRLSTQEIDNRLKELEQILPTINPIIPPPQNNKTEPSYPRNPVLPSLLKNKRNYTCQVCGAKGFGKPDGTLFISHHHMVPMHRGMEIKTNPDIPSNILIVCTWCHNMFEYGTRQLKQRIYQDLLNRGVVNQSKINELRGLNII